LSNSVEFVIESRQMAFLAAGTAKSQSRGAIGASRKTFKRDLAALRNAKELTITVVSPQLAGQLGHYFRFNSLISWAEASAAARKSFGSTKVTREKTPTGRATSKIKRLLGSAGAFAALALTFGSAEAAPNIILLIGDDMGVETLGFYGVGENTAETPNLDQLARDGLRFNNFWGQPVCSPTRATILTGRYGFRTGIGRPAGGGPLPEPPEIPDWALPLVAPVGGAMGMGMGAAEAGGMGGGMGAPTGGTDDHLRNLPRQTLLPDEYALPMAFNANSTLGYRKAAIGKWHLAGPENGWLDHPNNVGFDHFSGLMGGGPESYFAWNKVVNGEAEGVVGYTPADKADDALAWLDDQGDQPWLLWLAFNLPHSPNHTPPDDSRLGTTERRYQAMIEAMDYQVGRILGSLEPEVRDNTYVIFMGDNGTPGGEASAPFQGDRVKGTIYQGGINLPLVVSGPEVPAGTVTDSLVNSTDLFATIMEMAGIDPTETVPDTVTHDSISFLDVLKDPAATTREWVYADEFFGGFQGVEIADYAIRDSRYKLLRFNLVEEFYDLENDPYEHDNLLERELTADENVAFVALRDEVARLRASE
jgi:arylsulfatase A-like enzyme